MIWIISGPSSAGKSTFVKNPRCHEITGLAASAPMITPARQSGFAAQDLGDCFFHYNICRPAWAALRDKRSDVRDLSAEKKAAACQFGSDAKWVDLLQNKAEKKAVVLVADKATILDRVNRRRFVEPHVSTGKDKRYNAEFWQKLYERTDLTGVYKAWCAELERCKIPYVLINANDSRYSVLPPDFTFDAAAKHSMSPASLSKEEIEKILREEKFAYHRVNLPYGLHTDGQDRSATRDRPGTPGSSCRAPATRRATGSPSSTHRGWIDAGYRGEVRVLLLNTDRERVLRDRPGRSDRAAAGGRRSPRWSRSRRPS